MDDKVALEEEAKSIFNLIASIVRLYMGHNWVRQVSGSASLMHFKVAPHRKLSQPFVPGLSCSFTTIKLKSSVFPHQSDTISDKI